MINKLSLLFSLTCTLATIMPIQAQDADTERLVQEEASDYYRKWLDEDVVYIITEEEREVFGSLRTAEEKEQFIEQFWFRRDPDPRTAENEFKEEHYRRIAYSNERFSSGLPGWKSDRGRVYVIHGPPAEIESHPAGGHYERPLSEGGGSTVTFPFEVWRYRQIDGVGSDIVLEFVDPSLSGEYRLADRPEDKDALLFVPGGGPTLAEQMGLATKGERPFFQPGNRDRYPLMHQTQKDNPFVRYETLMQVQRPLEIKYQDLKEMVQVSVDYASIPLKVHEDYFRLNAQQVLVPITLQIQNENLSYQREGDRHVARLAVYGIITTMSNRLVLEFEDDLVSSVKSSELQQGLARKSIYQKVVSLDVKMRHKLDLVVKDLNSSQVGAIRRGIVPPRVQTDKLQTSSFVLADYLEVLETLPDEDEMFLVGDVRVRPNLDREFTSDVPLGIYFHLYNSGIDQASLAPSLELAYKLIRDGEVIVEDADLDGESLQFFSGQRVVIAKSIDLENLALGTYEVQVEVLDRLKGQTITLRESFKLIEPGSSSQAN